MKNLLVMMFLMAGVFSFAGNEIDPVKVVKNDATVGCCTVGGFTACREPYEGDPCRAARQQYCMVNSCTQQTINGTYPPGSGGSCIKSCDCGGTPEGDGGTVTVN